MRACAVVFNAAKHSVIVLRTPGISLILDGKYVDTIQYLDTFELTRSGLEVHGRTPLIHFQRLMSDLPEQPDTMAEWSVKGEKNALGQYYLHLRIKAAPVLECQRCLAPMVWPVDLQSSLQVVNSEADLDGGLIKGDSVNGDDTEDSVERIVGSRRLDASALIEDEIILSLPYVPKHDICPAAAQDGAAHEPDASEDHSSPFAVLGQLKKN